MNFKLYFISRLSFSVSGPDVAQMYDITRLLWFCVCRFIVCVDTRGVLRYDNHLVPPYINKIPAASTANSPEYEEWLQIGYVLQLLPVCYVTSCKGVAAPCYWLTGVGILNFFKLIISYNCDFIHHKKFVGLSQRLTVTSFYCCSVVIETCHVRVSINLIRIKSLDAFDWGSKRWRLCSGNLVTKYDKETKILETERRSTRSHSVKTRFARGYGPVVRQTAESKIRWTASYTKEFVLII